jgi:hypothetical protein
MGMPTIETDIADKETNPIDITEKDMIYNLARFGYREFGTSVNKALDYSIEYIVTAILLKGDARRIEAIPVLFLKNVVAINSELLVFLCKKYNVMEKLLSLFSTDKVIKYSIEEKLRLYDVYSNSTTT